MDFKKHMIIRKQMRKNKCFEVLELYVKNNIKEYIIVCIIFLIGLFLGSFFINNIEENKKHEIKEYIVTYLKEFEEKTIDYRETINYEIKENIILVLIIWFAGSTIIGIPIVLGIIAFRGFCLGYTISACTYVLGTGKGILFVASTLIIQNLIFIPALITLGVSCLKLYQAILKDKRRENIKMEIVRHTFISIIMLIIIILASILETQISTRLLKIVINKL